MAGLFCFMRQSLSNFGDCQLCSAQPVLTIEKLWKR